MKPAGRTVRRSGIVSTIGLGAAGAAVVALPWVRSGERWRDGWEIIDLTARLDLADSPPERALLWAAAMVPALFGLAVTALAARRPRLVGLAGLVGGSAALGAALVAWNIPLEAGIGPAVAAAGGAVAVATGLVCVGSPRPRSTVALTRRRVPGP